MSNGEAIPQGQDDEEAAELAKQSILHIEAAAAKLSDSKAKVIKA
jgi:hypothetical protein